MSILWVNMSSGPKGAKGSSRSPLIIAVTSCIGGTRTYRKVLSIAAATEFERPEHAFRRKESFSPSFGGPGRGPVIFRAVPMFFEGRIEATRQRPMGNGQWAMAEGPMALALALALAMAMGVTSHGLPPNPIADGPWPMAHGSEAPPAASPPVSTRGKSSTGSYECAGYGSHLRSFRNQGPGATPSSIWTSGEFEAFVLRRGRY
jgi:hypothetical protein